MVINYLNLTNGLMAVEEYELKNYRVMRLCSSYCEQKLWQDILWAVPDDFYFNIVLDNTVVIYDYGANKPVSRALWQGLEWVKYAMTMLLMEEEYQPIGRASQMKEYFAEALANLDRKTKKRIRYYQPLLIGHRPICDRIGYVSSSIKELPRKEFLYEFISNLSNDTLMP